MPNLVSCAVYLSSSAHGIVSRIAARATGRVAVVDTFVDPRYARSSVKLVGEPEDLLAAATAVATEGLALLDLSQEPHPAPHPRQGAVDMVAFMPLSEAASSELSAEMATCDALAASLGAALGSHGCPVLLFGDAAGRTLLEARRLTSFFRSTKAAAPREAQLDAPPSFGPAEVPQRLGVSVVGAMPYVTNFNLQVEGAELGACKRAADALRAAMGVQVMALPYGDDGVVVEIGCNLQASKERPTPQRDAVTACVRAELPEGATLSGYVVGLTPGEARARAEEMLAAGPAGAG